MRSMRTTCASTSRASGHGGRGVNTTDSTLRIADIARIPDGDLEDLTTALMEKAESESPAARSSTV